MKTIKFVAYLIYTSNKKNEYGVPYLNAILGLTLLSCLNILAILVLLNQSSILPSFDEEHRVIVFFKIALFIIPISLLYFLIIKKSDLERIHYDKDKVKRGNIYLLLYFLLSVCLLVIVIWYKKGIVAQ